MHRPIDYNLEHDRLLMKPIGTHADRARPPDRMNDRFGRGTAVRLRRDIESPTCYGYQRGGSCTLP
jgi:hypothetical protein